MTNYEVWSKVFSCKEGKQIMVKVGEFDRYINAHIFAEAYAEHYNTEPMIVEVKKNKA